MVQIIALAAILLFSLCVIALVRLATEVLNFSSRSRYDLLNAQVQRIAYSKPLSLCMSIPGVSSYLKEIQILRPKLTPEVLGLIVLVFCLIAAFVVSFLFQSLFAGIIGALLAIFVLYLRAQQIKSKIEQENIALMPEIYRSLANSLSTGHSVQQALEYVGEKSPGYIGEAFAACAYKIKTGTVTDTALKELEHDLNLPGIKLLSISLSISQQTGSALQELFEKASQTIEESSGLERDLVVKTSQAKLSAKIIVALPILLLLFISLISSDFRAGLTQPVGLAYLIFGIVLDALGLFLIRLILQVEVHV